MNIVYLLTNKSKSSGKRFYIGSKSECKIIKIDGVDTMISTTTGKIYMSSSTSVEFKDDIAAGHIFEVSILEDVGQLNRKRLVEIENQWIIKMDAVNSDEYYNKGYARLNSRDTGKLSNRYGEIVSVLAKNNSSMSKRDSKARKLGFKHFGEYAFDAWKRYKEMGENWAQVAYSYGKYKNYVRTTLEGIDMEKAIKDLEKDCTEELRKYIRESCSLKRACELLDIELPAGRMMLGDYEESRSFSVARMQGKSKSELEIEITKQILDGKSYRQVSNEMGLVYETVKRYFLKCIRSRLKSSDL